MTAGAVGRSGPARRSSGKTSSGPPGPLAGARGCPRSGSAGRGRRASRALAFARRLRHDARRGSVRRLRWRARVTGNRSPRRSPRARAGAGTSNPPSVDRAGPAKVQPPPRSVQHASGEQEALWSASLPPSPSRLDVSCSPIGRPCTDVAAGHLPPAPALTVGLISPPRGSQPHPPGPPPHEWGGGNVSHWTQRVEAVVRWGGVGWRTDLEGWKLMAPRARWMKQRPTGAEAFLWEQLRRGRLGVRFRRSVVIGRFIVDFLCVSRRLIVEVDGAVHDARRDAPSRRRTLSSRTFV